MAEFIPYTAIDVSPQSGYNYMHKYRYLKKSKDFRESLYMLLLFGEFTHCIKWFLIKTGIDNQNDAITFFTKNLADWQFHKHIEQLKAVVHSFKR